MATATIYPTGSWMRNAISGGTWQRYSTVSTDGIDWIGIGGASSANNYYAWQTWPTGSSFLDPAKYTISSATIQCYQNYYRGSAYTDRIVTAFGKLTPTGTNGLSNIQSTVYMSPKNTDGIWLDAVSCTAGARALQSGTATGVHFMMEKQPNNVRYSELAAYTMTNYRSRIVVNYSNRTYTLTVWTGSAGNTTGGGTYAWGTSRTITCTPYTGYRFVRWEFTGLSVSSSTSSTYTFTMPTNNVTANPIYEKITYTISYNGNAQGGGTVSGVPASQTKTYGVTLTLSSTRPIHTSINRTEWVVYCDSNGGTASTVTRTDTTYTTVSFSKWNTNTSGTGTSYNPGGSYTTNASDVLYAIWNKSTGTPSVTLPSTAGTKTGYAFIGWSTTPTATTATYNPGATFRPTSTATTLYAVWELQEIPITYVDDYIGYYRLVGPANYNLATEQGIDITIEPNMGYMVTDLEVSSHTGTTGSWFPLITGMKWYKNETYHFTHAQITQGLANPDEIEIRAKSYYYPRLNKGDTEHFVRYKDELGNIVNCIPWTYDSTYNMWRPGYKENSNVDYVTDAPVLATQLMFLFSISFNITIFTAEYLDNSETIPTQTSPLNSFYCASNRPVKVTIEGDVNISGISGQVGNAISDFELTNGQSADLPGIKVYDVIINGNRVEFTFIATYATKDDQLYAMIFINQ